MKKNTKNINTDSTNIREISITGQYKKKIKQFTDFEFLHGRRDHHLFAIVEAIQFL